MRYFNIMPGPASGKRLRGASRFTELLGRDTTRYLKINFLTLLGFAPFGIGLAVSILSSSVLILIPACLIGGVPAGASLCGMYDCIFRSLRDAPGTAMANYKKAWKQNFRGSVLPGMLFCLIIGFYCFALAMFGWARTRQTAGTYAAYLAGLLVFSVIFTVLWPLITLFEQRWADRIRNVILFTARYFLKVLGCAVLNILYWGVFILFLPWSLILLPLTGFWFILFLTGFLLFDPVNETFKLEEAISEAFPDQVPYYETDAQWAERRRAEQDKPEMNVQDETGLR